MALRGTMPVTSELVTAAGAAGAAAVGSGVLEPHAIVAIRAAVIDANIVVRMNHEW